MTLPLHLQMQIDIHAQLHQKEISAAFARLRAKQPAVPPPDRMAALQAALMNAALNQMGAYQQMQNAHPLNHPFGFDGGIGNALTGGFLYGNAMARFPF